LTKEYAGLYICNNPDDEYRGKPKIYLLCHKKIPRLALIAPSTPFGKGDLFYFAKTLNFITTIGVWELIAVYGGKAVVPESL
jgi:hypothetical protein